MSKPKLTSIRAYIAQKDADQIRAAFLFAGSAEGYSSMTQLIEEAVLKEVRRLQRKHNAGRLWEPVPPGTLRPGRRTLMEEGRNGAR